MIHLAKRPKSTDTKRVKGCPQVISEISYLFRDEDEIKAIAVNGRGDVLSVTLSTGKKLTFEPHTKCDIFEIHVYGSR